MLRATCELSMREPCFAQQCRSMAAVSSMQPHMRQALVEISQRMRYVDLVIEMRDARIPHTSANYNLINITRGKCKRLLLLNKADLAHPSFRKVLFLFGTQAATHTEILVCASCKTPVHACRRRCLSWNLRIRWCCSLAHLHRASQQMFLGQCTLLSKVG
jgi:ribosome biogenesis GTPase A